MWFLFVQLSVLYIDCNCCLSLSIIFTFLCFISQFLSPKVLRLCEILISPDIFIEDKVLEDEPCAVDDDEEGEAGEAGLPLVHPAAVGEGRGEVDQAGDGGPGRVDRHPVQDEPAEDGQVTRGVL